MKFGKRYNTPNSTDNQTVKPRTNGSNLLGSGMARKAAKGAKSYRQRMRDRMRQAGL